MALKGEVKFNARVLSAHISFGPLVVDRTGQSVESVQLACPTGDDVVGSVKVVGVDSEAQGMETAKAAIESLLDRLSVEYATSFAAAKVVGSGFEPMDTSQALGIIPMTGYLYLEGGSIRAVRGLNSGAVKDLLERPDARGEQFFSLFRAARRSQGPVEEFMHLYSMLLVLAPHDSQAEVDQCILRFRPSTPLSLSPNKARKSETRYTRLRNEMAHRRPGVNLEQTKAEIAEVVGDFRALVRDVVKAI